MSNIDKRALLKIAESVDREEWDVLDNGDDEYQVIVSGSLERGATYRSYRPVANEIPEQEIAAFIAAANPATVLALLDENIQLLREKDAIEAVALALRDDMRDAREQLEEAEKQVEEFTMWIKRLAHSLRNAKPDSKLHGAVMDYLSRKGLISVEDVLR
ncbi:TPA: ead/Ea22-like family protein [Salmonella enterica]